MKITNNSIIEFFKQRDVILLGALYKQQRDLENEFDLLTVFDDLLIENAWSRIFAYLINSQNSHALGNEFLKFFISEGANVSVDFNRFSRKVRIQKTDIVYVQSEWQTKAKRRLDILIEVTDSKGKLKGVIGIENKLFAGEQTAQVADYQKELNERYKRIAKILIFLSPDGRSSVSMNHDDVECPCVSMSYQSIVNAINIDIDNAKLGNRNAITFLKILKQHMKKLTNTKTEDEKIKNLVSKIYNKKNSNNRLIIEALMQNLPGTRNIIELLKNKLHEYDQISQKAKSDDWFFYFYPESGNPYEFKIDLPGLYLKKMKLYVTYVLLADRNPRIGSTFQLRIAVWKENSDYESVQIRRAFEIEGSRGELKDWANKCWVNIWTGDRYTLQDFGKKDAEGLFNIFKSAYEETYQRLIEICKSAK